MQDEIEDLKRRINDAQRAHDALLASNQSMMEWTRQRQSEVLALQKSVEELTTLIQRNPLFRLANLLTRLFGKTPANAKEKAGDSIQPLDRSDQQP